MAQNQCEHIRPDGARCQAPLQTGRSFCFFHDPEQQEKRAAARRNGGFMRDQASRATSRTDAPPLLPDNVPYIAVQTRDEIAYALQMIVCWLLLGQIDPKVANGVIFALSVASANLAAEERKEREAARSAERAAIRAERAAERAAREACTKQAIERAVERAVQQALAKAPRPFPPEDGLGSSLSQKGGASAPKEEPVIIDASTPWDLSQFGGKKPRISCVVPVFTSMRTGKIIDVNEPNPLDPPEHMLRDEFRRKPQAPSAPASAEAAQSDAASRAEQQLVSGEDVSKRREDLYQGTTSVVPKKLEAEQHRSAEACPGTPWGPSEPRPVQAEDRSHNRPSRKGGGSETEEDAERRRRLSPYSITSLLVEQPQPPRPPDPSATPPTPPAPPKPPAKPGPRLHPWIEYWGLH